MLKPDFVKVINIDWLPAAFRRLCVETADKLVVELLADPAAFRRLCVETMPILQVIDLYKTSRLQAAVC